MRTIVITEAQSSYLKEANDGRFSTQELDNLRTFAERVRYCRQHLGEPIGNGSSRMVFQIDDEKCLKLAKNGKGVAQNDVEAEYWKRRYDIFPKVFESDDENSMWIICEYVLPAKAADFKACAGISFKEFVRWMRTTFGRYNSEWYRYFYEKMPDEEYCRYLDNSEFLQEMEDYLCNSCIANVDILRISNWGLAKRDGGGFPVLLDHGLTDDVYKRFYRRG